MGDEEPPVPPGVQQPHPPAVTDDDPPVPPGVPQPPPAVTDNDPPPVPPCVLQPPPAVTNNDGSGSSSSSSSSPSRLMSDDDSDSDAPYEFPPDLDGGVLAYEDSRKSLGYHRLILTCNMHHGCEKKRNLGHKQMCNFGEKEPLAFPLPLVPPLPLVGPEPLVLH